MIHIILANMEDAPGLLVLLAVASYVFIFALVTICLIRMSRYFLTAGKEQKLMRMEMGKMAEEVHLLRQKLEGGKNSDSSTKTG